MPVLVLVQLLVLLLVLVLVLVLVRGSHPLGSRLSLPLSPTHC
jgi:hypothetical protein